jgi:hypothetical protein
VSFRIFYLNPKSFFVIVIAYKQYTIHYFALSKYSIHSKTSRSLVGSGNIAIYGIEALECINLVYKSNHFEDVKLISNCALKKSLKKFA